MSCTSSDPVKRFLLFQIFPEMPPPAGVNEFTAAAEAPPMAMGPDGLPAKRVNERGKVVPVVPSGRSGEGILSRNVLIEPHRAEVFSNLLERAVEILSGSTGQAVDQLLGAVGSRPQALSKEQHQGIRLNVGQVRASAGL